MKAYFKLAIILSMSLFISGCARDLSSDVYTSDSTQSLTVEGVVIAVRPVIIKETDRPGENTGGMLAGGAVGGILGNQIGKGSGNTIATLGGLVGGAVAGNMAQGRLSQSKGLEYIIKVDPNKIRSYTYEGNAAMRSAIAAATTSGLLTIVQSEKAPVSVGQSVYVIFSGNRTRVIPS